MLNTLIGYIRVWFGRGEDAGQYTVNASLAFDKAEKNLPVVEVISLPEVTWQMPATPEAIAAACKDYTFVVTDTDGVDHTFTGGDAAILKAYKHAFESTRGEHRIEAQRLYMALRGAGKDRGKAIAEVREFFAAQADRIRADVMSFTSFGGGSGSVNGAKPDAESLDLDTLRKLAIAKGWAK